MKTKYSIQCKNCELYFSKWKYEIEKIKNPLNYVCKPCKAKNCREKNICPICKNNFISLKRENKTTCSYS